MADLIAMLGAAAGAAAGGGEVDPNFNQTVLLLHGDGTDGAQNNTFLDSSTNNFTITRAGNTTQGTFSPFSVADGRWSNYFDGTGDYLTVAYDSALTMPAGTDFCIEAWVYKTVDGAVKTIASSYPGATDNNWLLRINASNKLNLYVHPDATVSGAVSTTSVTANEWFHVAATRSGTTWRLFVNGNLESTVTATQDVGNANAIYIGSREDSSTQDWSGYISNYRMVVGSAVYTASFTPSTSPLTAITNTELLTCQSNRFVDNSSNAFAITVNGNTSVQPFSPFAPSAAYSPTTNGGSGYFDGTGDYLTLSPDSVFRPSGDFTLEAWIYIPNVSGLKNILATLDASSTYSLNLAVNNANARFILGPYSGGAYAVNIAAGTVVVNAWNHIAVARSGSGSNNIRMWLNGSSVAQATSTATPNTEISVDIGRENFAGGNVFNGYMSGLRLVTGSAAYDPANSTITIPTAPPTAITNTSLLCNFTNAGIFDQTGKNNLETVGNAQIDTTTKKYGTGSMEFDGTGDYLAMGGGQTQNFAFGSGDFTIEMWIYFDVVNATQTFLDGRPASANGAYPLIYVSSNGTIRYFVDSADRITGTTTLSASTWYHLAISRSGTSTKMFLDGVQEGSTYTDSNSYLGTTNRPIIGCNLGTGSPTQVLDGFIDDLRITKGVARYTTTFTPPDKAFPDE